MIATMSIADFRRTYGIRGMFRQHMPQIIQYDGTQLCAVCLHKLSDTCKIVSVLIPHIAVMFMDIVYTGETATTTVVIDDSVDRDLLITTVGLFNGMSNVMIKIQDDLMIADYDVQTVHAILNFKL